jgi:hypothetical protein
MHDIAPAVHGMHDIAPERHRWKTCNRICLHHSCFFCLSKNSGSYSLCSFLITWSPRPKIEDVCFRAACYILPAHMHIDGSSLQRCVLLLSSASRRHLWFSAVRVTGGARNHVGSIAFHGPYVQTCVASCYHWGTFKMLCFISGWMHGRWMCPWTLVDASDHGRIYEVGACILSFLSFISTTVRMWWRQREKIIVDTSESLRVRFKYTTSQTKF